MSNKKITKFIQYSVGQFIESTMYLFDNHHQGMWFVDYFGELITVKCWMFVL